MIKNLPVNARDSGSIPGSERSPGEGNGNPHQYSYLENPMDRGAWWATVVHKELDMTEATEHTHRNVMSLGPPTYSRTGVPDPWNLMPDDLRWS